MKTKINVFEKAVAFSIEIGCIGITKKVNSEKIQLKEQYGEQPEEKSLKVAKELINSKDFDSIRSVDGAIRMDISKLTLPSSFKRGVYLIPFKNIQKVDKLVNEYKENRQKHIESFLKSYSNSIKEAENRLGGLFNINDYTAKESVKKAFYVRTSYIDFGIPQNLKNVSPEIFQKEQEAFQKRLDNAVNVVEGALMESFKELVDHMVDRLTPDVDGKPKVFKEASIINFKEFIFNFSARNITENQDLEELVKKAKNILSGVNSDDIRKTNNIRKDVQEGLGKIKEKLDIMIDTVPERKFNYDDM